MPFIEIVIYTGTFLTLYFAIFVLSIFLGSREPQEQTQSQGLKPRRTGFFPPVALIVPCYNEQEHINKVLHSLLNSDYPKDKLEIIVVDDGSRDQTLLKAMALAETTKQIRVFHKENGGKYTALNYGLKKTKAGFVGSVDADSYLEPAALKEIMVSFQDPKVMAVVGTVKIGEPKTILEWVQYVEYLLGAFIRYTFSLVESINVTPGPLSVFRKEVFKTLGEYRPAYQTEDLEIAFRLQRANLKIVHASRAIVWTKGCRTFAELFYQRLRWRRGFLLNLKDYPDLLDIRRHGNLSFLLLYSILSCFISLTFVGYGLWIMSYFLFAKINYLFLVGFDLPRLSAFSFEQFLFGLKPLSVLGIIALVIFLLYLLASKKLFLDKLPVKRGTIFFLLLYNLLDTTWWLSAIFSVLTKREPVWH